MRLEIFDFIDDTIKILQRKNNIYEYVLQQLEIIFTNMMQQETDDFIGIQSRIKSVDSLREKLIRNKYYLHYETGQQAIDHLPDLLGLTIECRFISNEVEIYNKLLKNFDLGEKDYFIYKNNPNICLNLRMSQPQLQRNGFTIYRIDGYYVYDGEKINFELQIKSLIHTFWSDVEHQVVYKNTQFVVYDNFMKSILASIRDNLDVVDHQLQIVYNQLKEQVATDTEIGMSEQGFKIFIAKSINDLVAVKMHESVGFKSDFKKCSSILSQYIYLKDFVSNHNSQFKMIEYFEHFNLLKISELDFTQPIFLEKSFNHQNKFCDILGKYWQKKINVDFEWHVFFIMLFAIQPGNNIQDFTQFVEILRGLICPYSWYQTQLLNYADQADDIREDIMTTIAKTLVQVNKIDIIHEDNLYQIMLILRNLMQNLENNYPTCDDFTKKRDIILSNLKHQILQIFS